MGQETDFVFGYGSLVDKQRLAKFLHRDKLDKMPITFCRLKGYRRVWNVAMDNTVDIQNYKYYLDTITGERPNVYVTFLNIRPSPDDTIGGVLFRVSPADLELLDRRERNYQRIAVSKEIEPEVSGTVWTYIGRLASEESFLQGLSQNTAVISRDYYQIAYHGYGSWGEEALRDYLNSTDKPDIPLRDLKLVSLKDSSITTTD